VLTTSYKQVIQPIVAQTLAEEDDEDVPDDNDDNDDDEDSIINEVSRFQLPSATDRQSWTSSSRQTTKTTRTQIGGVRNFNQPAQSDALRRLTVGGGTTTSFRSSTSNAFNGNNNYETVAPPSDNLSAGTAYKRRYTTNPTAVTSTSRYNGNADDDDDDDDDDAAVDDDLLDSRNAPYLSDFTRRLAELKADPLAKDLNRGTYKAPPSISSPSAYRTSVGPDYYRTQVERRGVGSLAYRTQQPNTVSGAFTAFVRACDTKIRRPLLITLVVLFLVFFYVFFIHN